MSTDGVVAAASALNAEGDLCGDTADAAAVSSVGEYTPAASRSQLMQLMHSGDGSTVGKGGAL